MTALDLDFSDLSPIVPADDIEPATLLEPDLKIEVNTQAGARSHALLVPLKVNGKWLRKITLRLPSQGEIDDYVNGDLASRRAFLARLADLDPLVIKALRWPDSEAVHQLFHDIVPQFVSEG
ncbi:hypothetical protein [Rhizobium sp. FKY42]|uniref:hypothetical protein n=1 Tax=Rhizobium sp. FKY42 TaxID=2562310 RepID=UPI0010BFB49A|nr:hypothetical protein [Rhizobium sp. FKY42]